MKLKRQGLDTTSQMGTVRPLSCAPEWYLLYAQLDCMFSVLAYTKKFLTIFVYNFKIALFNLTNSTRFISMDIFKTNPTKYFLQAPSSKYNYLKKIPKQNLFSKPAVRHVD